MIPMAIKKTLSSANTKFLFLKKSFKNKPFKLLDIGAGNHSASKTVFVFPKCEYYGVDLNKDYNNNSDDFKSMKGFFEMDLTKLDFSIIPNNHYDGIWIVHVIEHLFNGDSVIEKLIPKLKSGGFMYIEYPGQKSTTLPHMNGSLNFYDDNSHVRVYSITELKNLFQKNNCTVLNAGTRRNLYYIVAMPFRILSYWLAGKKLKGNIFWDILGFAEFLYIRKK
ncbi:MAG: class I SAM-dependent methyltransferase [Bacteroidetes bacterium]|nr:class I SAM-dependent methyltransferase [Bacteroidota bacterium]